ncbi:MAG: 2-oxoisovalerate dehydrogenase [Spirochaetes bacterium GWF1_51_8]|nr:MAG: 2-oxoisovalerate dehydrogenase [Spirochaetes bacterium GWF1_51_8]
MNEIIFLIEEDDGGGFTARALGESIFTEGDTVDELKANIRDAIQCHYEKPADIPKVIRLHFVKEEVIFYA